MARNAWRYQLGESKAKDLHALFKKYTWALCVPCFKFKAVLSQKSNSLGLDLSAGLFTKRLVISMLLLCCFPAAAGSEHCSVSTLA